MPSAIADQIRNYVWEMCGVYFVRCGGVIPDSNLVVIKRILKNTTAGHDLEFPKTALNRVASDVQAVCFWIEADNNKFPSIPFAQEKIDKIFEYYREYTQLDR